MPIKVTTTDGKIHEVAESLSMAALRSKRWVTVKTSTANRVVQVQMSQVIRIEETPDKAAPKGPAMRVAKRGPTKAQRNTPDF